MSSRYNTKKVCNLPVSTNNNILNKENEGGPLNMVKKVQQQQIVKKGILETKPVLNKAKSLIS